MVGYSVDDWIFKSIIKHKTFYEIDLLRYIRFILSGKEGSIIDVGANIGNHSVFFGLFTACRVIAIEANPAVFPILRENLLANKVDGLCYEVGLGSEEGLFSISVPSGMGENIGAAKLSPSLQGSIRVTTLDDLVDDWSDEIKSYPIRAIKADIEGMEYQMLKGALKTIQEHGPDLFLEISTKDEMIKIMDLLKPLGYRRITSWAATPVWHFTLRKNVTLVFWVRVFVYKGFERFFARNFRKVIKIIKAS